MAVALAGCGGAVGSTTAADRHAGPPAATASPAASTVIAAAASPVVATAAASTVPAPASGGATPPTHRHTSRRARPAFHYTATALTQALRAEMRGSSWHTGCPVGLGHLRYLRISYWGFDRRPHLGEMVVNRTAVADLRTAFGTLFAHRLPIRQMRLVDHYGGNDYASIQADNTSAFNCRNVTGGSSWSEHAYGLAIDINPIENPYVSTDGTTAHAASKPYLNRSDVRRGMAVAGGTLVRAFDAIGWGWGGRWPLPTDYQHFSENGK